MTHAVTRLAGAVASVVLVTGCGDTGGGTREPADPSPAGRTYVVTELDDPRHRLRPGATIRLDLSEDQVGAYAGCNHMSGLLDLADGVLVVDALGMTEMACDPPLMAHDAWVADLLTSRPAYAVDGSTLTLVSGDTTVRLREIEPASQS